MGTWVTPRSLGDLMDSILARDASNMGSIPALGTIFPIFITPIYIYMYTYSKASLNRLTTRPTLNGPFSEVISLGS